MYTLQSLHGYLSGFHFLIFWRKNCCVAQSLISKGTKFQILVQRMNQKLQFEGFQCAIKKLHNRPFPGHVDADSRL